MKRPWFRFWVGDFLGDTRTRLMDAEAVGAYLLILLACWDDGSVPDDPEALRVLARAREDTWPRSWALIAPCLEPVPGGAGKLHSPKMTAEIQAARARYEVAVTASKAATKARASRAKIEDTRQVTPLDSCGVTQSESESESVNNNNPGTNPGPVAAAAARGGGGGKAPRKAPQPQHPKTAEVADFLAQGIRAWKRAELGDEAPKTRADTSSKSLMAIDRLLRLDGRDPEDVRSVIWWLFGDDDWCYAPTGEFDWRPNILSGEALRRQYDRLWSARRRTMETE